MTKEMEENVKEAKNFRKQGEALALQASVLFEKAKYLEGIVLKADDDEYFKNGMTFENVLNRPNPSGDYNDPDSWYCKTRDFLEQFEESGIDVSGYFTDTKQRAVNLQFTKENTFEKQLGLLSIIEFIKPLEKHNMKRIGIHEHTCAEYGIYTLLVGEKECKITLTTYGYERDVGSFKTVKKALEYIWENLAFKNEREDD